MSEPKIKESTFVALTEGVDLTEEEIAVMRDEFNLPIKEGVTMPPAGPLRKRLLQKAVLKCSQSNPKPPRTDFGPDLQM